MAAGIDFSMLGTAQVINLCLQRSDRLGKLIPSRSRSGDAWDGLMAEAVSRQREAILAAVWGEIEDVFAQIAPQIEAVRPQRLADIGCGQAFIDLLIHRQFGCDLVLVDIEESADIHFGFAEDGAGYADLATARAFLVANGIPETAITTINPRHQSLRSSGKVDMAMSLLSCGFHYPVETYDTYFRDQTERAILLDCRRAKGGKQALSAYGRVTEVAEGKKHSRLLCIKV